MDSTTLWAQALDDLERQMTQATFDTWLKGTRVISTKGKTLVVGVRNANAVEWLGHRLRPMIDRTVARLSERRMDVQFVVAADVAVDEVKKDAEKEEESAPAPDKRRFVVPEFDVLSAGFFQMASYESLFWAPFLGRIPWRVVEIVRETDKRGTKRTEWTPARRWTAPSLAELVPCGRQAIVGVDRACDKDHPGAFQVETGVWRRHQDGAFDRLQAAAAANVERRGDPPHVTYWVSVRNQLGLLQPEQVVTLKPRLQEKHDRWLADRGFDPRDWDV